MRELLFKRQAELSEKAQQRQTEVLGRLHARHRPLADELAAVATEELRALVQEKKAEREKAKKAKGGKSEEAEEEAEEGFVDPAAAVAPVVPEPAKPQDEEEEEEESGSEEESGDDDDDDMEVSAFYIQEYMSPIPYHAACRRHSTSRSDFPLTNSAPAPPPSCSWRWCPQPRRPRRPASPRPQCPRPVAS